MKAYINQRMNLWLRRRIPPSQKHHLSSKNVFIFPSAFGFAFLFLTLIIFLLGTNYQNNTILMFSFLLSSMFITSMLFSFQNLNRLSIQLIKAPIGYAEQFSYLTISVLGARRRHAICFHIESNSIDDNLVSDIDSDSCKIKVPSFHKRRGVLPLSRLRLSSTYPLGLFNTWTRLDLNCEQISYPKPKLPEQWQQGQSIDESIDLNSTQQSSQVGEFYQLENYQQGQSLSLVAWKQLAKSQQWLSRGHAAAIVDDVWLDFEQMKGQNIEIKLSQLCALVIEYGQLNRSFGLKLPNTEILPDTGELHQLACLKALALV